MRINVGPGYRIYYVKRGMDYVVLCAGDKATQPGDIKKAARLAAELE